jgi:hypothetical protein
MKGFCIFILALFEGEVPSCIGENHKPVVFATEEEAEFEIIDFVSDRFEEYLDGERDLEDAMTVEEFVLPAEC